MRYTMVKRQTRNAEKILFLLRENINHLESKWKVYQKQGYLFDTSSFGLTVEYINELIDRIEDIDKTIGCIYGENSDCGINNILDIEGNKIPSDDLTIKDAELDVYRKILFENPNESSLEDFIEKLSQIDDSLMNIYKISNIKDNTYIKIENISDLLNALDFNFSKRLIGIDTTEIGTELDTRSFGNIQIIYNAAEALMHDYVSSIKGVKEYNGQVVFGFRNRAISFPKSQVVVCPSYAEFNLEYLSVLAHEAFHVIDKSEKDEKIADDIAKIRGNLKDIIEPFADKWSDRDISLNISEMSTDKIISDVIADIFAICVGGDAYYSTMQKFYIPLLFDLNVREINGVSIRDYLHSSYSISSLRSRIFNLAYLEIYGNNKKYIEYTEYINRWENLSKNVNRYYAVQNEDCEKKTETLAYINSISNQIQIVENEIKNRNIISDIQNLIDIKHTDLDKIDLIHHNLFSEDGCVINLFSGKPTINQLNEVWTENDWLKPRHILSMYTENKKMNRNSVLFTLANHKSIRDRYKLNIR